MVNIDMAHKVLRSIFNHPREHQQNAWFNYAPSSPFDKFSVEVTADAMDKEELCGTSACIAGWAALHHGWKIRLYGNGVVGNLPDNEFVVIDPYGEPVDSGYGFSPDLEEAGQEALGLEDAEVDSIFYQMDNGTAVVLLYAKTLPGNEHKILEGDLIESVKEKFGIELNKSDFSDRFDYEKEVVAHAYPLIKRIYEEQKVGV